MLSTSTPEGDERIVARVVSFSNRNFANCIGHPLVGDVEKTGQQFFRRSGVWERMKDHFQRGTGSLHVYWNSDLIRIKPPEKQVYVGHGQWPTRAITGRPRICPGTLRPDEQFAAIETADRTPTGSDGFDIQYRCQNTCPAYLMFKLIIEVTVEAAYVCAGAAHVESDHTVVSSLPTNHGGSHKSTGRTT